MPHHHEDRNFPYTPEQMFDLVAGVEHYPAFLPWCKAARIVQRDQGLLIADLMIGYKMFQEKFRSRVTLERASRISVDYQSGPLSHLSNEWRFAPDGKGGCRLSFDVDFDFRSSILRTVMDGFFDKALIKMVGAFEERATQLYG